MKDAFLTRKMETIPLPVGEEPTPGAPASRDRASGAPLSAPTSESAWQTGAPASRGRASGAPLSAPASEGAWQTGAAATERTTDPAMAVAGVVHAGKERATLAVVTGISAGQVHALDGLEHVIGRGTDADVWIEDGGVSRRHARLTCREDGRYFVEDLGSTNGTFVAGERVTRSEIRPGDRLQVGPHVTLRFQITGDAEEQLQRRLYESSTRDGLTRVYNRKYFNERLVAEVAYSRRHRVKLAVLLVDLDDFKQVNDTHGHLAGDMVLRLVAAKMQRLIRIEDLLARYGGEEFVILARSTGKTDAARLGERIRDAIRGLEIPVTPGHLVRCTLSIGVAALPDVSPDGGPTELLALADARLYRAKALGKDRVCAEDGV